MPETTRDSSQPSIGLGVLHLFYRLAPLADPEEVIAAVKRAEADGDQVVSVAILGHKADLAVMALGDDLWRLRRLQSDLHFAGLDLVDSYVSLTEMSEYSQGLPEEMRRVRLHPQLPPEGKPNWCFYPMSKRRGESQNWFTVPYEDRKAMMHEHGVSGRKFAGRIVQVISGSTGIDDYEWGVTLFGEHLDDLKEVVYTMRFDTASAIYAEFGQFYSGLVAPISEVLNRIGLAAE